MTERRYKILAVLPEFLVDFFKGDNLSLLSTPLPSDVRIVGIGTSMNRWMYDPEFHQLMIILESEEWDVVPVGQPIAHLEPAIIHKHASH